MSASSSSSSNAVFTWPDPVKDGDLPPSSLFSDDALSQRRGSAVYIADDASSPPASPPRFNRTISAPLPTTRGFLRPSTLPVSPLSTLSSELADSLQSAIQTLLHLSPPHLLDNAKEQYSGCAVQMPTTSVSALLTSMRSLNYLASNVHALSEPTAPMRKTEDFDIGELVQNVADLLGGQAAQSGVDLVLFHGDTGIKHTSVHGDVEGLGYLLGHVSAL
jgi:osomolarity two-component system response regulator SSK1